MFVVVVYGYRHMGACDYFHYNGGEYHVTARIYHFQYIPLSATAPLLRLPGMGDVGVPVTQVPGAAGRCLKWAMLRIFSSWVGLIAGIAGVLLILFDILAVGIALCFIAAFSTVFAVWAWRTKPKCSPEQAQMYLNLLRPRQHWPPGVPHMAGEGANADLQQDSFGQAPETRSNIRFESLTLSKSSDSEDRMGSAHSFKEPEKAVHLINIPQAHIEEEQRNKDPEPLKRHGSLIDQSIDEE